jgi:hypothetical protein
MEDRDFVTFYQLVVGYKEDENTTIYAHFVMDDTIVCHNFPTWVEDDCSTISDSDDDSAYDDEIPAPSIPCYFHYSARSDCPKCITSYTGLQQDKYITAKLNDYETTILYQKNAWICEPSEVETYTAFLQEKKIPLEKICFVEKSGDYKLA